VIDFFGVEVIKSKGLLDMCGSPNHNNSTLHSGRFLGK
jgi:hypothetical protein